MHRLVLLVDQHSGVIFETHLGIKLLNQGVAGERDAFRGHAVDTSQTCLGATNLNGTGFESDVSDPKSVRQASREYGTHGNPLPSRAVQAHQDLRRGVGHQMQADGQIEHLVGYGHLVLTLLGAREIHRARDLARLIVLDKGLGTRHTQLNLLGRGIGNHQMFGKLIIEVNGLGDLHPFASQNRHPQNNGDHESDGPKEPNITSCAPKKLFRFHHEKTLPSPSPMSKKHLRIRGPAARPHSPREARRGPKLGSRGRSSNRAGRAAAGC